MATACACLMTLIFNSNKRMIMRFMCDIVRRARTHYIKAKIASLARKLDSIAISHEDQAQLVIIQWVGRVWAGGRLGRLDIATLLVTLHKICVFNGWSRLQWLISFEVADPLWWSAPPIALLILLLVSVIGLSEMLRIYPVEEDDAISNDCVPLDLLQLGSSSIIYIEATDRGRNLLGLFDVAHLDWNICIFYNNEAKSL